MEYNYDRDRKPTWKTSRRLLKNPGACQWPSLAIDHNGNWFGWAVKCGYQAEFEREMAREREKENMQQKPPEEV